jgi:hypothetical protein
MTQTEKLLRLLRTERSVSSLEVTLRAGIVNVTGRVSDLRKEGYDVQVHRDETGVFRYRLIENLELGL